MGLTVVTGPPAAGKSTWVRAHAQAGDVVIDYDLLANALTAPGASAHDHTRAVRHVAFRARSAAIAEALRHVGEVEVYIIHSVPSAEAQQRYAHHDARIVAIDPGKDVVEQRIAEQRPRSARAAATRWYSSSPSQSVTEAKASRKW